ncbi:hypothetical protein F966_01389 [Acinetobacter higginsii]|uniref:DUF2357 domain-containing protein n=1 Tax=Acinetobacter higginsii TaxID=70347 RepID=N8WE79_9GAMM|nr:hypothetical protein [Acinetobacter higginsii]ENV10216.1 hypothetical protein F966_01389 [Acinetobacter higginsii]
MSEGKWSANQQNEDPSSHMNDSSLFTTDQEIGGIADVIIEKLFADERLEQLLTKSILSSSVKERPRTNRQKKKNKSYILLEELIPKDNNRLKSRIKEDKSLEEYLAVIETLYREFDVEYIDFPIDKENLKRGSNDWLFLYNRIDFLMRAEVFMLVLLFKPTPAFIDSPSQLQQIEKESLAQLEKRVTNLGRELLYLCKHKDFIQRLEGNYFTRNIQILAAYFKAEFSLRNKKISKFTLEQDMNVSSLVSLNRLLIGLKNFADSGEFEPYKNNLSIRQREGDAEHTIVKLSHIDAAKKWKQSSERLRKAIQYFQGYKKQDIVLYRFRLEIEYTKNEGRVSYEKFQKFFTLLNKKAARSEGFPGYLSFVYFWRENFNTENLVQDILIIFNANSLIEKKTQQEGAVTNIRDIPNEFSTYIFDYLKVSSECFEGKETKLNFQPIPILQNQEWNMPAELIIESGDKEKWTFFEKRVLPYFIFLETFDVDYIDDIKSRFSRGQKTI